jgi:glucan biosynthesis protein C
MGAQVTEREHSWDMLRALLMLLGIPFHAALPYSTGANTIVLSDDPSLLAEVVGSLLHSFRMGTFFAVAGYFAAHAITRKGPAAWWSLRWRNLAIPLAAGLVCFIPLQLFIRALDAAGAGSATDDVFLALLSQPGPYWTGHLWFLIVLLEFCVLTALLWPRLRPRLTDLGAHLADHPALLVAAFVVPLVLLPRIVLSLLGLDRGAVPTLLDLRRFVEYAPFFVLGMTLFLSPAFLDRFTRLQPETVVAAVSACIAFAACDYAGLGSWAIAAKAAAATLTCAVLVGLARRYFTRPRASIRWLVGAAFTIYLFHFPLTCLAAYLLEPTALAPELRMAIIIVSALAVSCLIHLVVARSPVLLLLFNGRPARA